MRREIRPHRISRRAASQSRLSRHQSQYDYPRISKNGCRGECHDRRRIDNGAEDGVMTEGLTADEAAAAILPELAKFSDEFVIGNCDSSKMVEMKRNNQTQIFRGLEQMAASLHQ